MAEPSNVYGPVENADDTRQAQHTMSNDHPVDVNSNAVLARSQALTLDIASKNFTNAGDRRTIIADFMAGLLQAHQTPPKP